MRLEWDQALHKTAGKSDCVNGREANSGPYCLPHGYMRHLGNKFSNLTGLPVTAQPEIAGLAGGYGWLLKLNSGAPKVLNITEVEVMPDTPLLLSVQYPLQTNVTVTAKAAWCDASCSKSCEERFTEVASIKDVRGSNGNVFHHNRSTGLLTIRVIMFPLRYTGLPDWKLYNFNDVEDGEYALDRFERKGVLLPRAAYSAQNISIVANCAPGGPNNAYCAQTRSNADVDTAVCSPGFVQVSYDRCCQSATSTICEYPYSTTAAPTAAPTPLSAVRQILENGGFEGKLCPWAGSWGVGFNLETSIKRSGNYAAKISRRTQSYEGLRQDIFGKLKLDRPYQFQGFVYILNTLDGNRVQIKMNAKYAASACTDSYHSVFESSALTRNTWHNMSRSNFILRSSDLRQSCTLVGLELYVESYGFTFDFIVDDLSMTLMD